MEKRNEIKHIIRNGTTVIKRLVNQQWRVLDLILGRCKQMEEELEKLNRDKNEDQE